MTITLEKIKEMNLPVGALIELTINKLFSKGTFKDLPNGEECKLVGYFYKLHEDGTWKNFITYNPQKGHRFLPEEKVFIEFIEDLKILEYKK